MPRQNYVCLQVQMPPEMRESLETMAGPRQASAVVRKLVQKELTRFFAARSLPVKKKQKGA